MTPRPPVVNIIGIRVHHHYQYLLFASLKYGRVTLGVMCVLLCIQLWATSTSFLLQGTLKLHAHLLVLLLELSGTGLSWQFYTGPPHIAPSFYPGCTHTCLRHFSSRPPLTLINGCFLSRIRIRICLPPLISCRSYISSVRRKYYAFAFFDG